LSTRLPGNILENAAVADQRAANFPVLQSAWVVPKGPEKGGSQYFPKRVCVDVFPGIMREGTGFYPPPGIDMHCPPADGHAAALGIIFIFRQVNKDNRFFFSVDGKLLFEPVRLFHGRKKPQVFLFYRDKFIVKAEGAAGPHHRIDKNTASNIVNIGIGTDGGKAEYHFAAAAQLHCVKDGLINPLPASSVGLTAIAAGTHTPSDWSNRFLRRDARTKLAIIRRFAKRRRSVSFFQILKMA
jgi:hypothetical protein